MAPIPVPRSRPARAVLLLTVLAALALGLPALSAPAGAADALLSQGRPVTASSVENGGTPAAAAVDGNPGTRWSSAFADPQWIQVDLGASATLSRVVLRWETAYGRAFEIRTATAPGGPWTTVHSTSTGTGGTQTLAVTGTGRYVRMYGTQRGTGYGYSLWEFQVYGTAGGTAPGGRLVFADEFDDPAGTPPSAARWTAETGPAQNNELQYYTPNRNAATDGAGNLVIEARREVTAGSSCPGGPCRYTSGRINTAGKFTFTYGRVEARIRVSGTQGLWPAFWLLGANFPQVGWPASGEIDVMEHIGKVPDTTYSTVHGPGYYGGGGIGGPYTIGADFAAGFHTFGLEWDAGRLTFLVDGTAFRTLTRAQVETRGPWVFDHPFFLILNNAVGGDWPGPPDGSTVLPQRMLVDYVRVYQ